MHVFTFFSCWVLRICGYDKNSSAPSKSFRGFLVAESSNYNYIRLIVLTVNLEVIDSNRKHVLNNISNSILDPARALALKNKKLKQFLSSSSFVITFFSISYPTMSHCWSASGVTDNSLSLSATLFKYFRKSCPPNCILMVFNEHRQETMFTLCSLVL